jgi:hypothetical protein
MYGRYLDIFISHAPPWGIHDQPDLPHQGIKAFRWLLETFRPRYHFHGHIHVYRQDVQTVSQYLSTTVINTYGFAETLVDPINCGSKAINIKRSLEENQVIKD